MLAYEVILDGKRIALAGMEDWAVMSVAISAVRGDANNPDDLHMHVGGMSNAGKDGITYHSRWGRPQLAIGSEILVKIVDCDEPDIPTKRHRSDAEVQECPFTEEEMREMRYQDYLALKAEFDGNSPE